MSPLAATATGGAAGAGAVYGTLGTAMLPGWG